MTVAAVPPESPAAPVEATPLSQAAPITSDQEAQSLLIAAMDALEAPADTEQPTPEAPVEAAEGTNSPAEGESAPAAEQPSSGKEDDGTAEPEPAKPASLIEPPLSWSKEAKGVWDSLPPTAQAIVAERERARDTEVRRVQNDVAEQRKTAQAAQESAEQAAVQLRNQYIERLTVIEQAAAQQFQDEFAGVDWAKLAQDDPSGYVQLSHRYNQKQAAFQATQQERQRAVNEAVDQHKKATEAEQAKRAKAQQDYIEHEVKQLTDKVPEFRDAEKRTKLQGRITEYLRAKGFTDQELVNLTDHRTVMVVLDALKVPDLDAKLKAVDTARSTAANKVAAAPPKVLKPAVPPDPDQSETQRLQEHKRALSKARSTHDQAAALAAFLT